MKLSVCISWLLSTIPAGPQRIPSLLKHAEEPGAKLSALHHRQTPETLQEGPASPQQVWSVWMFQCQLSPFYCCSFYVKKPLFAVRFSNLCNGHANVQKNLLYPHPLTTFTEWIYQIVLFKDVPQEYWHMNSFYWKVVILCICFMKENIPTLNRDVFLHLQSEMLSINDQPLISPLICQVMSVDLNKSRIAGCKWYANV